MKKCLIIYCSYHHFNTKKLVTEISKKFYEIETLCLPINGTINLDNYEFIGFASAIYMGKPAQVLLEFIKNNSSSLQGRKVFFILTSGTNSIKYKRQFKKFLENIGCTVREGYSCKGYDTYGFFKFIGGISKGHPNRKDISNAISYCESLK